MSNNCKTCRWYGAEHIDDPWGGDELGVCRRLDDDGLMDGDFCGPEGGCDHYEWKGQVTRDEKLL